MRLSDAQRNADGNADQQAGSNADAQAGVARTKSAWAAIIAFPVMHVGVRVRREARGDGYEELLSAIAYLPRSVRPRAPDSPLAERAARQIERYRDDPDAPFDLPLASAGSPFQRAVWAQISSIARGRTRTYGELAQALGANARAVGQACGDNPYPVVVPCHRVVAADGLGGFSHHRDGFLIEAKKWLLQHECPTLQQQPGTLWHAAS